MAKSDLATTRKAWAAIVNAGFTEADDAKVAKIALEARQPMGRLVSPSEIANAIIFLASPTQASITGTSLNIDGGLHSLRIPK